MERKQQLARQTVIEAQPINRLSIDLTQTLAEIAEIQSELETFKKVRTIRRTSRLKSIVMLGLTAVTLIEGGILYKQHQDLLSSQAQVKRLVEDDNRVALPYYIVQPPLPVKTSTPITHIGHGVTSVPTRLPSKVGTPSPQEITGKKYIPTETPIIPQEATSVLTSVALVFGRTY